MSKIPDIIDNRKHLLKDSINNLVKYAKSGKIAAGYFYLSGFDIIKDNLNPNCSIDVIIGDETDLNTATEITKGYNLKSKEKTIQAIIDSTQELDDIQREKIYYLSEYIKEGKINFKIYTKDKFHSKSYIFDVEYNNGDIEESYAIIGSSNFSKRGLGESSKYGCNTELNATLRQNSAIDEVKEWFDEIWEESDDFNENLLNIINKNIKHEKLEYSPMDILLKSLYCLYKDSNLFDDIKHDLDNLAYFQRVAVNKAIYILNKYNGVIIADSVGLGKTYIGIGLLKYFYDLDKKILIICPASLYTMWFNECKNNDLNVEIKTQEDIGRNGLNQGFMDSIECILIDETHNFRNDSSERFKELINYTANKKIIQLTATPINNSIMDLYNIMSMFLKDDEFKKTFGIQNLKDYMKNYTNNKDKVNSIINEVLIKRSRNFIKSKYFSNDVSNLNGIEFKFPMRKIYTVNYSLSKIYGDDVLDDIFTKLEILNLPIIKRDNIDEYKIVTGKCLIKIILLKRMESSIKSFRLSIKKQKEYCKFILESINEGFVVCKEDIFNIDEQYIDSKYKISLDNYSGNIPKLIKELKEDYEIFKSILSILDDTFLHDNKLDTLVNLLNSELKNRKILLFTQYKDTARYIYNKLKENIVDLNIEVIDGSNKINKQDIINRFAPKANNFNILDDNEIDILISTDILSEGQNLQDSNTVINYDLPWNPVRIIQRGGRIDRITTEHDYIYLYNFMPDKDLDKLLNLVDKLNKKISSINGTIGNESQILSDTEEVIDKVFNDENKTDNIRMMMDSENIEQYFLEVEQNIEYEFANEEYMQYDYKKLILENSKNKSKVESMPNNIFTTRVCDKFKGVFIYYKTDSNDYWLFYDTNTKKWIENKEYIYRIISYGNKLDLTPIVKDIKIDINKILEEGKTKAISSEEFIKQNALSPIDKDFKIREIIKRLKTISDCKISKSRLKKEEKELIKLKINKAKICIKKLSNRLPRGVEKKLKGVNIKNISDNDLLNKLEDILKDIYNTTSDEIKYPSLELICYEVFL